MNTDAVTAVLGRAVDFMFVDDRKATSMGLLFGAFVLMLSKLFSPVLRKQEVVDFDAVPAYLMVIAGAFLFNLPRFFRGDTLPQSADDRLKVVRAELRANRLTREEGHALYKKVLEEELTAMLAQRNPTSAKSRRRSPPPPGFRPDAA
ncbi:MAG TPA: hypothetical protein VGF48_07195 [Thermoanaerobaculia bacterium]|jgi:hypothetical protein